MKLKARKGLKVILEDRFRVKIFYYANGEMDHQIECFEKGKWRSSSTTFYDKAPTWDKLHEFHYLGEGDDCFMAPGPLNGITAHLKYTAHCLALKKRKGPRDAAGDSERKEK